PAGASFDKQGSMKINFNKNPVRFPHKMRSAFCYKRIRENLRERARELGRKVVEILPQLDCRNSGKTEATFCFKMKPVHREHMRKWAAELCS
ncbi:MAG TPA: hypothetical protein VMV89_10435, partial [Candidatus Paceibacterota bacterium]|nr:hypothetical protein [Candidatus Paceibacterota bacterium]